MSGPGGALAANGVVGLLRPFSWLHGWVALVGSLVSARKLVRLGDGRVEELCVGVEIVRSRCVLRVDCGAECDPVRFIVAYVRVSARASAKLHVAPVASFADAG